MKPRSDSKLKTLPEDRQAAIAEYARGNSLAATVAWLKEDGLSTSSAAVSEWLSWYLLRQQLSRNESTVETLLEQLKSDRPDLNEEQLTAAGQAFFGALAIEQRDAKSWKRIQDVRIKGQALKLEEKKFQVQTCELFLRWCEDQRAKEIVEGKAANSEKIEALRQLMFGDLTAETAESAKK